MYWSSWSFRIRRVPEILFGVLITPLVFVTLFAYVFGGSIDIPGGSYREFLMGGIFAQTVIFGATFTGAGLADDMQKGIIDRFRSLPMSRSAVLVGTGRVTGIFLKVAQAMTRTVRTPMPR